MIAFGFRVKSGRAIAVALAGPASSPRAIARRVIEMCDPETPETRQPYHNGFYQTEEDQRAIMRRIRIVERCTGRAVEAFLADSCLAGQRCRAAALVVGSVIDPKTVGNPHIRAHAYEGQLFRRVLDEELRRNGVETDVIVEKELGPYARKRLRRSDRDIKRVVDGFGKALGRPWRGDEKSAAIAAWIGIS